MHAKSDSEVPSLPSSSPARSPGRRPAYYVQSPARTESLHDGDSIHSPVNSPLHPGYARSRDSPHSFSRLLPCDYSQSPARSTKQGWRKVQPQPNHQDGGRSEKGAAGWSTCTVIDEEPPLRKPSEGSQIYKLVVLLLGCAVFLVLFILFFWLIFKPVRPAVSVKSVVFRNFNLGEGTDASGVPTLMLTINCTVQIDYTNPSKHFAAHVSPLKVELGLSDVVVATGEVTGYSQRKKSRNIIPVIVQGIKVPLYGASNAQIMVDSNQARVPLQMTASLRSKFLIMGDMIKRRFRMLVNCDLVVNAATMDLSTPITNTCTYNPPS